MVSNAAYREVNVTTEQTNMELMQTSGDGSNKQDCVAMMQQLGIR